MPDGDLEDRLPQVLPPPAPGAAVVVWWLDSGAGSTELPASGACALAVKETHGRVIEYDEETQSVLLAMCSAGDDDERSELARIWWPSVRRWV